MSCPCFPVPLKYRNDNNMHYRNQAHGSYLEGRPGYPEKDSEVFDMQLDFRIFEPETDGNSSLAVQINQDDRLQLTWNPE